jgi:hypothetical protein
VKSIISADIGVGRGAKPRDVVRREIIRERHIGFDAEQKARRQHKVVTDLYAAAEAPEGAAEIGERSASDTCAFPRL